MQAWQKLSKNIQRPVALQLMAEQPSLWSVRSARGALISALDWPLALEVLEAGNSDTLAWNTALPHMPWEQGLSALQQSLSWQ